MEKKKSIKKYFTLGFFAVAVLAIVIAIVATPTKFRWEDREDGNYDLEITFVNRVSSKVTVPAQYEGKKVTSFLVRAYTGDKTTYDKVKTIILEEGIEEVNATLLTRYPNLEKLELPSTIKAVYGGMPDGIEVVIAEGAELELKSGCFINTKTMTVTGAQNYAEIPDGVKAIGESAFQGTKLKTISIPASVESIGDSAFAGVEVDEVFDLELGSNLKYVGYSAFASAMTINKVTISTTLPLSEGLFGSYKSNGAKIINMVCDVQPYVVKSIKAEKLERSHFILSALNNEAPYLYLKTNVTVVNENGKIASLAYKKLTESDLAGYDKYTTAETTNKDGYYMLMFQKSTSDY